ncbi:pyrroline-5-carboxylate reductase [Olsenella sp. AF21-51]|uniref:pyrroline-5-carboxylate reductase n=1 Tax=Olsenella sp. AF21-51 TaxID=2292239 RepID=UPI000E5569F8|nr:pyrroline-5-carboxylate reductase [Olsenella sp. AF21-51]RGS50428.1 pyrroline-5-carboxylate reductase [Olsenella sp. AF21-51]
MAEKIEQVIGVIGAGSMGVAIARGLVASGAAAPEHVLVANPSAGKLAPLAEIGIKTFTSNDELLAQDPDAVVLAVKPQVLPGVLAEHTEGLAGRLVISIAAGISVASLESALAASRVVRAMPNLPVQVLSGATAVCPGSRATKEDLDLSLAIFSALGSAVVLREDQLDAEGAVVSCGPAYVALLVDDLTRAGVERGLPAVACRELVLSTMRGVAEQLLASGEHPRAYMEKVTSPGGTTAAGLRAMESGMFEVACAGVDAAVRRTRELSEAAGGKTTDD